MKAQFAFSLIYCLIQNTAFAQSIDEVLFGHMQEIQRDIGENPRELGMDGVLFKFDELGRKLLKERNGFSTRRPFAIT